MSAEIPMEAVNDFNWTGKMSPKQDPKVSFVVPCYKLAHLLPECVNSILGQSFGDFEILIMDDHSPDDTPEVAATFGDSRVQHIRNDPNLGALRNYNKGIALSRGKYVWLISADDYLRSPRVLERYVQLLETQPNVGYVFCPGIGVRDGKETGVIRYSTLGGPDRVLRGHDFLATLLKGNLVLAPATLARRDCYERITYFPIDLRWAGEPVDMIWGGDWYVWLAFALHHDVGYFAEPMVCYREHALAMTAIVTDAAIRNCFLADVAVPWMIKQQAEVLGHRHVVVNCLRSLAAEYARHLVGKQYRSSVSKISAEDFEDSLCRNTSDEAERAWMRAHTLAAVGDQLFDRGDRAAARHAVRQATKQDPWMLKAQLKRLLLSLGAPGDFLRRLLQSL